MKKSEALKLLAGALSVRAVLDKHPELDCEALRALLLEAADAVKDGEIQAAGRGGEKAVKAGKAGQTGFVFEAPEVGPGGVSLRIHTDGASRGNPGEAGIGVVIEDETGRIIREIRRYIGKATNNQAEYAALLEGLKAACELTADSITVFADSELLVKQVKGEYKVKHPQLQPLFIKAKSLVSNFKHFNILHVPREKNAHADALANEAIDKKITGSL